MVLLQPDPFLNELTSMYERSTEQGSVWVTLKRSSLKSKVQRNKMKTAGDSIEYRCLIRATDGKKTISTSIKQERNSVQGSYHKHNKEYREQEMLDGLQSLGRVGAKDHQRFQASYATILKAHMTALKKRERKDKKKAAEGAVSKKARQGS